MSYNYKFSVIMAVYNAEEYLCEAVDSIISQDIGFNHIQLILVDDGSKDKSPKICDEYRSKYPDNIIVIHKENGGVASARNEGLKLATGRYINFADSDDKFTLNTFSQVYNFFKDKENETDVVTIPLTYFDARKGPHWQNWKFTNGNRIIDLNNEYENTLMFVNASFFSNSVKNLINFDSNLVSGEDMKVCITVLAEKMTLGVINTCQYLYRRRKSSSEQSLIQTSRTKKGWFTDYLTHLVDWAIGFCNNKFGYIPPFFQYELLSDLQWRFKDDVDTTGIFTEEEFNEYSQKLFSTLKHFEDKYIAIQKRLLPEQICFMLSKKHGTAPTLTPQDSDILIHFGDTEINFVSNIASKIDFLKLNGNNLYIEGFTKIYGVDEDEPLKVYIKLNNELIPCEIIKRNNINSYRFNEIVSRGVEFRCNMVLDKKVKNNRITVVLECRDIKIEKKRIWFGIFAPISQQYKNSYLIKDGWLVKSNNGAITIQKANALFFIKNELKFTKELYKDGTDGRKAILARTLYHIIKVFKRKEIWLISDRIMKADDNGEAFLKYILDNDIKNIKVYYILSKDSADFNRMSQFANVVHAMSFKHKLLHLLCDFNISSHAEAVTINPLWGKRYNDIVYDKPFIFLQHGITKDDMSRWLNRYNKNLYGFITAANPEYKSIIEGENYHYTENEIWLTGFPRFDRLYHDEKKAVTIMPTWRRYLASHIDHETGIWYLKSDFTDSKYYKFYNGLLNSQKLIDAANEYGYTLQFMPHPNLQFHKKMFNKHKDVKFLDIDTKYRDIYAQSELVVTDYSSACFDFAYLRKPIVYCQFDADEFFKGEHVYTKGYFDYELNGFGEVEHDLDSTIDRIIEYMKNGCKLKDKYKERINGFFAFDDRENCRRLYEKIQSIKGTKR